MTNLCIVHGDRRLVFLILLQSTSARVGPIRTDMNTRTIVHLLPSNANFAGFFPMSAWGFTGLTGFFGADDQKRSVLETAPN